MGTGAHVHTNKIILKFRASHPMAAGLYVSVSSSHMTPGWGRGCQCQSHAGHTNRNGRAKCGHPTSERKGNLPSGGHKGVQVLMWLRPLTPAEGLSWRPIRAAESSSVSKKTGRLAQKLRMLTVLSEDPGSGPRTTWPSQPP